MHRKLILSVLMCGALVALISPAAANATTFTDTGSEEDTFVTFFSNDLTVATSVGTLFCNYVDLNSSVENGVEAHLTSIWGSIRSTGEAECAVLNSKGEIFTKATITTFAAEALLTGGKGDLTFSFDYDVTVGPGASITCEFSTGLSGVPFTYTEGPEAVLSFEESSLVGSGTGCPSEGTLNLSLAYDGSIDE